MGVFLIKNTLAERGNVGWNVAAREYLMLNRRIEARGVNQN